MNEINTEQNQKPRTSKLAKASIICLGVFFGLILVMFGFYILIGLSIGIFVTIDDSCPWLAALLPQWFLGFFKWIFESTCPTWFEQSYFMVMKYTLFGAPILGIAALMHIGLCKGRLRGIGLAIASIVIPICLLLFLIGLNHLKRYMQRSVCVSQLKEISNAIKLYSNDNDDQLPTPESWCDILVIQYDVEPRDFRGQRELCDTIGGESAYALNKSVVGMTLSDIPGDVVLLFETTYGRTDSERDTPREARDYFWKINDPNYKWNVLERKDLIYKDRWNQVGGKEILTTEYHGDKGCHVLFADGTVKFIKTKHLDTLCWEP